VADDHRLLARIALAQKSGPGDQDAARQHLDRALAIYTNTGQSSRAAETRQALRALTPGSAGNKGG